MQIRDHMWFIDPLFFFCSSCIVLFILLLVHWIAVKLRVILFRNHISSKEERRKTVARVMQLIFNAIIWLILDPCAEIEHGRWQGTGWLCAYPWRERVSVSHCTRRGRVNVGWEIENKELPLKLTRKFLYFPYSNAQLLSPDSSSSTWLTFSSVLVDLVLRYDRFENKEEKWEFNLQNFPLQYQRFGKREGMSWNVSNLFFFFFFCVSSSASACYYAILHLHTDWANVQ